MTQVEKPKILKVAYATRYSKVSSKKAYCFHWHGVDLFFAEIAHNKWAVFHKGTGATIPNMHRFRTIGDAKRRFEKQMFYTWGESKNILKGELSKERKVFLANLIDTMLRKLFEEINT